MHLKQNKWIHIPLSNTSITISNFPALFHVYFVSFLSILRLHVIPAIVFHQRSFRKPLLYSTGTLQTRRLQESGLATEAHRLESGNRCEKWKVRVYLKECVENQVWAVLGLFSMLCSSTPHTVVLLTTQGSRWHNSNFTNENTEQQDLSFLSQAHEAGRWGHLDVHCVREVQQKNKGSESIPRALQGQENTTS